MRTPAQTAAATLHFLGQVSGSLSCTLPIAADLTITRLVAGGVQMRGRYARLSALPQADLGPVCTENPIRID
jgi:hypothetical protein